MNKVILMGRLTKDAELRHSNSGTAVASFTIAVDRPYSKDREKETDFINCVAWKGRAEFVSKYFSKGSMIAVEGRMQNRSWEDKTGNKRISTEVICDNIEFCGGKKDSSSADYAELTDDDGDLPF